ncbi:hypothetical protein GCM10023169_37820 [Georgenia halophila]|uniref:Uncharacterized protein n=1 Tax=Georgenia halophila TaxID=620889 RepID=A0ABP8LPW7_9MICO
MTVAGFQSGHPGFGADDVSVIFCTKYRDFRSRFPRLAPGIERADPGACTDFNVTVGLRGKPRLAEVRLDTCGLDELLRDIGRDDLVPQVTGLSAHPLADGLDQLHGHLLEMIGRAAGPATKQEWDGDHGE